ncbi:transcriptional regulator [Clostridium botulinum]|nr:transcriptional regulator [Clostridium botulinum]
MSLKTVVERIFEDNTSYIKPSQAVNQASSLNALSGDLYSDSKRFIYELLQNADDSFEYGKSVKVWIKVFDNNLVVAHSGRAFTDRDVQGICNVNNGTKKSDITKTGYKGIGFKSVFGQSDKVIIFTKGEYFRFDSSYLFDWKWEGTKSKWEKENDRKFQYPWQIIPIYTSENEITKSINEFLKDVDANVGTIIQMKNVDETSQAVQSLYENINIFLFLKNISEINFYIEKPVYIKINRSENNKISLIKDNELCNKWLINTVELEVPSELKADLQNERDIPEKLLNTEYIELSLAARLDNDEITKLSNQEKLIYSYLPTGETKYSLPVLVNTSFLTIANRESLHANSKWNQWLFKAIAIEIFQWISKLVNTKFSSQAYKLIPQYICYDELGKMFNNGIDCALKEVAFIISRDGELIKVKDAIVDFTYLSEEKFIGGESIKNFVIKSKKDDEGNCKQFAKNNEFFSVLKKLGVLCFEWGDFKQFLLSKQFNDIHTVKRNIELIKYIKKLSESGKVKEISTEVLRTTPFIWDHKNHINYPCKVCFPTADDQNWNNPNSELSFVHQELQNSLFNDDEIRKWIEGLGVKEKTDITYISQIVIPKIDNYITSENAIQTIRDFYRLYKSGELKEELIQKLSRIKLKTQSGSFCRAEDCFLSDFYNPRLKIELFLEEDIFVSKEYCTNNLEKDEWKRFFKMFGVNEGIKKLVCKEKSKSELLNANFKAEYFETEDKKFNPFQSTFIADVFSNITTLNYIKFTENNTKFAFEFWSDYITNYSPNSIKEPAIAYWGYYGRPGRTQGDLVENFIPWYIKNVRCIPTVCGKCEVAPNIFINEKDIKDICGEYLPVLNGPELSSDWKAFFNFRTSLKLSDYLDLLNKISSDTDSKGKIKMGNYERIQCIYSLLLERCINWSAEDILEVEKWTDTGLMLNTKNEFTECNTLKYFIDGNESIFQEQYCFIKLSAPNKKSPNLEMFLNYFKIKILKQSEFELGCIESESCNTLKIKLNNTIPYFKAWIENEDIDDNVTEKLKVVQNKIESLEILQAKELKIIYKELEFTKNINVHFDKNSLYVTNPWDSNSVLLKLSEVLCRYFDLVGYDKKLDFILRSTNQEIEKYFIQESIEIPKEIIEIRSDFESEIEEKTITSFSDIENIVDEKNISPEFFHLCKHDYDSLKYIQQRITRSVKNVIEYLDELPQYDCSQSYQIADSIIGGILKNGNEIVVVARPSDNDEVLIYYSSEFDVLEYVDAEFWCEDGNNIPKQITLGQLLKKTGINRIPIKNILTEDFEFEKLTSTSKSEELDFNAVPYVPEKIAKVISSFANTNGGTLIFGIKEISSTLNEFVGLSTDFPVVNITKKAISLLNPIPVAAYNWLKVDEKSIFVIKIEKSEKDILLDSKKYIRQESNSILVNDTLENKSELRISNYRKTIAIIIAIEDYTTRSENQIPSVKYALKDANKFKKMLMKTMAVNEEDICMYINEDALKSNLEYQLKGLFYSLTEEDRLIFYYVGHGFHNGITNYLSTYDMHPYNISETAVSLRNILLDPLQKSKCKNALVFIDACAQNIKNENERSYIDDINDEEIRLVTNEFPYYAVFLSCQPGQKSYSSDNLSNGIWTYHLVKAISGDVPEVLKNNKYITDIALRDYLSNEVSKYSKDEIGIEQNPKAILESNHENVIVEISNSKDIYNKL